MSDSRYFQWKLQTTFHQSIDTIFLSCSWNNTLAIESVAAQRAELADLQRRNVYDSAVLDALDANGEGGENRLNKTELFSIYIPNLLVSPEEPDELLVGGEWYTFQLKYSKLFVLVSICGQVPLQRQSAYIPNKASKPCS